MVISLLLLVLAVLCYTVSQLLLFGQLKGQKDDTGYWGRRYWNRKYKWNQYGEMITAPSTWYYKFFKIKYKERFPLSATLLVAFTDGYHLSQMFFKLFLALSFAPLTGWIWAGVIWFCWGVFFTIFYKLLSR